MCYLTLFHCFVKDNGIPILNSTTDLVINVLDVADTPPEFLNLPYVTTVYENATVVRWRPQSPPPQLTPALERNEEDEEEKQKKKTSTVENQYYFLSWIFNVLDTKYLIFYFTHHYIL